MPRLWVNVVGFVGVLVSNWIQMSSRWPRFGSYTRTVT